MGIRSISALERCDNGLRPVPKHNLQEMDELSENKSCCTYNDSVFANTSH